MKNQGFILRSTLTSARGQSLVLAAALCLLLPILTGCGPKRMKADFIGFEKAYADTSNRQMLLNLARLQNRDPTYFFKLGQISSQYTMSATLSGTGNYTIPTPLTSNGGQNATGGGTPGVTFSNNPSFTFIPVNDQTNAQILLTPIQAETFYILYQQGWRADQLFRLMVDRIEMTHAYPDHCQIEVFRNVPPKPDKGTRGKTATYTHDAATLSSYATFLRISAIAYQLQRHGHLMVRGTSAFVPYDNDQADINPKDAPSASEMRMAAAANSSWHKGKNDVYIYGKEIIVPGFYLSPVAPKKDLLTGKILINPDNTIVTGPDLDQITADVMEGDFKELANGLVLDGTLDAMSQGFSIEGANPPPSQSNSACKAGTPSAPHIVLRSLLGMMSAVAQEEEPFQDLLDSNPMVLKTRFPPQPLPAGTPQQIVDAFNRKANYEASFKTSVPPLELLPALRLQRPPEAKDGPPLIELQYGNGHYLIADLEQYDVPENSYWNRDMFRLLSQLISQVTIDISKFPVPQILQLRTD